jgi:hypothetical protein
LAGRRSPNKISQSLDNNPAGSRQKSADRLSAAGHHHHIAGQYLLRYAQEASWREDNRRVDNGAQVQRLAGLAMKRKPSVDFSGYWQRHFQ